MKTLDLSKSTKHAKYGWIIDTDHHADMSAKAPSNTNATGMVGPEDINPTLANTLISDSTAGVKFQIVDEDDNSPIYSGRIIGPDYDGFEPLDDFGAPNFGATTIEYKDKHGIWKPL